MYLNIHVESHLQHKVATKKNPDKMYYIIKIVLWMTLRIIEIHFIIWILLTINAQSHYCTFTNPLSWCFKIIYKEMLVRDIIKYHTGSYNIVNFNYYSYKIWINMVAIHLKSN